MTEEFQYIPTDKVNERLRAFTLKKHEITMMAIKELDKIKNQLVFVSMEDYNKVVNENAILRAALAKLKQKQKDDSYISKTMIPTITGIDKSRVDEFLSAFNISKIKKGHSVKYCKQEILDNCELFDY